MSNPSPNVNKVHLELTAFISKGFTIVCACCMFEVVGTSVLKRIYLELQTKRFPFMCLFVLQAKRWQKDLYFVGTGCYLRVSTVPSENRCGCPAVTSCFLGGCHSFYVNVDILLSATLVWVTRLKGEGKMLENTLQAIITTNTGHYNIWVMHLS